MKIYIWMNPMLLSESVDKRQYSALFTLFVSQRLSQRLIWSSWSFNSNNVTLTQTHKRLGFPRGSILRLTWCSNLQDKLSWLCGVGRSHMTRHWRWGHECCGWKVDRSISTIQFCGWRLRLKAKRESAWSSECERVVNQWKIATSPKPLILLPSS